MIAGEGRLHEALSRALADRGFGELTDVQDAVCATEARNRDLLVLARTGSGKTIAFGLALGEILLGGDAPAADGSGKLAVVLAPTRELAAQVAEELAGLYRHTALRLLLCAGGQDPEAQGRALQEGVDVLVGTPGRVREQIRRGTLDPARCACLVLDEADELLAAEFEADIEPLLARNREAARRILLFSATITPGIEALARTVLEDPLRIDLAGAGERLSQIELQGIAVAPVERDQTIARLLRLHHPASAIVFCNRRQCAGRLAAKLQRRGFQVVTLSGGLRPAERMAGMARLNQGAARVCVATDVAARGLDVRHIELVIHAGLPDNERLLLHRSGRAGRGGQPGRAVLVVAPAERRRAERFARGLGRSVDWLVPPGVAAIRDADLERLGHDPVFSGEAGDYDRSVAEALRTRFSDEAISLACAQLWRHVQPLAEDLGTGTASPARALPRHSFAWLSIETGALTRADMGDVLRLICNATGLARDAVGRIHVGQGTSRFELPRTEVEGVLARAAAAPGPRIWQAGGG